MNLFSFLIVCATFIGSQAIKDEPKVNFGACYSELSKFDASDIISFFNDPENADFKELLRYLRDIGNEHQFDKPKTEDVVDMIFGKSDMNYLITEVVLVNRELNKQRFLCIIKQILGENETARAFTSDDLQFEGFIELIRKLRVRVKNFKFDEEKSRALLEYFVGKSKMINQFSELVKNGVEMGKPILLGLFNIILGDKTQEYFSLQDVDFKKPLRNLRAIIQNYKIDEDEIRDFFEEDLELGENELTELLPELIKIKADMNKRKLVDFINAYLGDKETQWDYASQEAEFVKLLRRLRDMIRDFIFDEDDIHTFVKIVLELRTSEVSHRITQLIKITLEMFKQHINDFINKYLGDIETPGAFSQTADLKKLKLLRHRILCHDFDEGNYFREFLGQSLEQPELTDHLYDALKTRGDGGRQRLLNFIDTILKDREVKGTNSKQQADPIAFRLRKRLEKLISRMRYNLSSLEGVRENKLLLKKAIAGYEKLLILGFDLNGKFKRTFEDLVNFDRLSSSKF